MKSYDNAEFILIKKIQHLKEKYQDIKEIAELEEEAKEIINQNCISSIQFAVLYLLGSEDNLNSETKEKIKGILQQVLGKKKDG